MSYLKKFKSELERIETPKKEKILGSAYSENNKAKKYSTKSKRQVLTVIVAITLCIAMVGGVAASLPAIVRYVNAKILSNNTYKLDTVPDGYIGIYSASDLNNIRNDLNGNYILMNDIDLENHIFTPIGNDSDVRFNGIFNGNGYTIKNLKLDSSALANGYLGLFGDTNGYFINLSIDGFQLDVVLDKPPHDICIGTVAGRATFVGGCYIKNCDIKIECIDLSENELYVGGLAGIADYLDSCAIYADISIQGNNGNVYAALGSASTFSAVTSYTVGSIVTKDNGFSSLHTSDVAITPTDANMPVLLSEQAMQIIFQKLDTHYGDDRFYLNKFKSFFIPIDEHSNLQYDKLVELNECFGYFLPEEYIKNRMIYVFDERANLDEVKAVSQVLESLFGSKEDMLNFYNDNYVKCGTINCYSFEAQKEVTTDVLHGFDFENIWANNKSIVPKIFLE